MASLYEAPAALFTLVWFFAGVDKFVLRKMTFLKKSLPTDITEMWFHTTMAPLVLVSMVPLGKSFAAHTTLKWLLL